MEEQQHQQPQSTPPTAHRQVLSLSSSMSPPTTPNRQRAVGWWQSSVVRRSSSAVDEAVDELTEKSRFLLRSTPRRSSSTPSQQQPLLESTNDDDIDEDEHAIASFDREEILAGELLGEGTFSSVYQVVGFQLNDDGHDKDSSALRRSIARANPARFALKHLKTSLLDNTHQFEQAATDLVMEAKYMAALNHPNILKLHGEPRHGTAAINSGVDGYFLLTDRLSETMAQRIERWKLGQDRSTNTVSCKLSYVLQIAKALSYLHQQRIIFRDLKPSNIGFHQEDTNRIQLFDFGLCRELPSRRTGQEYCYEEEHYTSMDLSEYSEELLVTDESWKEEEEEEELGDGASSREEVYLMSGAGTQIYMAPEILIQNRYNLKADVYSWAMTATELLLLEKPLPLYEMDEHIQYVCVEGDRPALEGHPEITENIRDLLAWAWEGNVAKRCNMAQVCEELREVMAQVNDTETAMDSNNAGDDNDRWPSKVWQAVRRFPRYLLSVLGRALSRVSCFFLSEGSASGAALEQTEKRSSQDGILDLPQEKKDEPDPSLSHQMEESSSENSDLVFLSPRPAPPRFSRSAILKRKPSSASTTATTDDEFDEDDMLSLSPTPYYNYNHSKPPMEALVERHNSAASSCTGC